MGGSRTTFAEPDTQDRQERVVLVAVDSHQYREWDTDESLDELERLVDTAGGVVVGRVVQRRELPDPRFYVGAGKMDEIKTLVDDLQADTVAVDDELTAVQARRIERALDVRIVDRTQVILDIFAQRARTKEGRLQVELAQLEYLLPRLIGQGLALSRLGGGIGTRGPGETRLEMDRRRIRRRIADLKRQVEQVRKHRTLHRARRKRSLPPVVALVGYTNAGKSTLLSALTGARVLVEDRLFATLDPTIRAVSQGSGQGFLLVDTVGFINKLPHQLVAAFRATLEEVVEADLIVHVVDVSSPRFDAERRVVQQVMGEMGVAGKPMVTACNKIDLLDKQQVEPLLSGIPNSVPVSAAKGWGLQDLIRCIESNLPNAPERVELAIPYTQGSVLDWVHQHGEVIRTSYEADAIHLTVKIPNRLAERVTPFRLA